MDFFFGLLAELTQLDSLTDTVYGCNCRQSTTRQPSSGPLLLPRRLGDRITDASDYLLQWMHSMKTWYRQTQCIKSRRVFCFSGKLTVLFLCNVNALLVSWYFFAPVWPFCWPEPSLSRSASPPKMIICDCSNEKGGICPAEILVISIRLNFTLDCNTKKYTHCLFAFFQ